MSTPLPPVDMTGAVVGQVFKIDFTQFVKFNAANREQKAHIGLFNESGDGLQIAMQASGNGQYLPAGAWVPFEIQPNDGSLTATVTYTLPNPPVSQLNGVYFAPGETVPTNYTLGNSPIGIGGTVNTSSVQTLSNEGNAANTLVEDIGDATFAQLFTIYTDGHCLWYVDQSGVRHQVIKIQTAGNPLQLGQAADATETLGDHVIDGSVFSNTIRDNVNGNTAIDLSAGTGAVTLPKGLSISSGFLAAIAGKQTTLNGSTSGTAVATCVIQSGVVLTTIFLNNFRNGNAGSQTLALPVSYIKGAHGFNGGTGIFSLLNSGITQSIAQLTALGAGGVNGTTSSQTAVRDNNIWHLGSNFDTISFAGSDAGAHTDFIIIIGS